MKDGRYNRAVFLPEKVCEPFSQEVSLQYSHHAKEACLSDRYGMVMNIPRKLTINPSRIVEVDVQNGQAVKALVRLPYNDRCDLVLVVGPPQGGSAFVRTLLLPHVSAMFQKRPKWFQTEPNGANGRMLGFL